MLEQVIGSRDGQWLLGGQSHFSLMPACIRVMLGQVVCFRDGILAILPPQCDACQPDSDAGHLNASRDILWLLGAPGTAPGTAPVEDSTQWWSYTGQSALRLSGGPERISVKNQGLRGKKEIGPRR